MSIKIKEFDKLASDINLCADAIIYTNELIESHQIHDTNEYIALEAYEILPINYYLKKLEGDTISLEGVSDWVSTIGEKIVKVYKWLIHKIKELANKVANFIAGEKASSKEKALLKLTNKRALDKIRKFTIKKHDKKGLFTKGVTYLSTKAMKRLTGDITIGNIKDKTITVNEIDRIVKTNPIIYQDKKGNKIVLVGNISKEDRKRFKEYLRFATSPDNLLKRMKELGDKTNDLRVISTRNYKDLVTIKNRLEKLTEKKRKVKEVKEAITFYEEYIKLLTDYLISLGTLTRSFKPIMYESKLSTTDDFATQLNTVLQIWMYPAFDKNTSYIKAAKKAAQSAAKKTDLYIDSIPGIIDNNTMLLKKVVKLEESKSSEIIERIKSPDLVNLSFPPPPKNGKETPAQMTKRINEYQRIRELQEDPKGASIRGYYDKLNPMVNKVVSLLQQIANLNKELVTSYATMGDILNTENRIDFFYSIFNGTPRFYVDKKLTNKDDIVKGLINGLYSNIIQ